MNTQKPCPDWIELLASRAEDLSLSEHIALNEHLQGCKACRDACEDYDTLITRVQAAVTSESSQHFTPQLADLRERIMVPQKEREVLSGWSRRRETAYGVASTSRFLRVISGFGACLLIAGLLLVSSLLFHRHPTTLVGSSHTPSPILTPGELYTQVTSSRPVLNDNLSGQDANRWDEMGTTDFGCAFTGRAYHISISTNGAVQECFAQATNFSNFAFQVEMTTLSGDGGGLIFRARSINSASYTSYRFRVSPDGTYDLCVSCGTDLTHILTSGQSSAIKTGLGQKHTLTVIARSDTIYLYVNGHLLEPPISNSVSSYGKIGFFAVDFSYASSVTFRNVKVWNI